MMDKSLFGDITCVLFRCDGTWSFLGYSKINLVCLNLNGILQKQYNEFISFRNYF